MRQTNGNWVATVGIDTLAGDDSPVRYEAGQVITSLPATSIPWLLAQGIIVPNGPTVGGDGDG